MSNFGLPGTGELLFRSYGGFLKDGANHFGEIGKFLILIIFGELSMIRFGAAGG